MHPKKDHTPADWDLINKSEVLLHDSGHLNLGGLSQRMVASPSFYNFTRFDTVTILGGKGETWYAKLIALFSYNTAKLAYVQWYIEKQNNLSDKFPMTEIELQANKFQVS